MVFVTVETDDPVEGYEVKTGTFPIKPARAERVYCVLDELVRKLVARETRKGPLGTLSPTMKVPAGAILYTTVTHHYH